MNSKQIYENYISLIINNISNNKNIKLNNEHDCLSNIFITSKFIFLLNVLEIKHLETNEPLYYIGLYQIQKLYFCLVLKPNTFNNYDNNISIFNEILKINKITFFDNVETYFKKYFNKQYFEQINKQLYIDIEIETQNKIKNIDDLNIEIIVRQTDLTFEQSKDLYYKNNKSIDDVLKLYFNIKNKSDNNISTNQQIYKQIREFLN